MFSRKSKSQSVVNQEPPVSLETALFCVNQIQSSLAILVTAGFLKADASVSISTLLSQVGQSGRDDARRSNWKTNLVKEKIANGDIITTLIEQIINVLVPGGATFIQGEAISHLVSIYAPKIAEAVTNPTYQATLSKMSINAAKSTHSAVTRSFKSGPSNVEAEPVTSATGSFPTRTEVTGTTSVESIDAYTRLTTSSFEPEPGKSITTIVLYVSDRPLDSEMAVARPVTGSSTDETSNTPSAPTAPLPPPRHPRGLSVDKDFQPLPPPIRKSGPVTADVASTFTFQARDN